jgi:hypothetical protein
LRRRLPSAGAGGFVPRCTEALKRLVVQRDAELVLMRLMLEKLKLQITRYKRDKFRASYWLTCW